MTELEARSRRLIQESKHPEPSLAECLRCQKPLIAVGISRNPKHHLEGLGRGRKSGVVQQLHSQRRGKLTQQYLHGDDLIRNVNTGLRSSRFERALEGTRNGPSGVFLRRPRVPTVKPILSLN